MKRWNLPLIFSSALLLSACAPQPSLPPQTLPELEQPTPSPPPEDFSNPNATLQAGQPLVQRADVQAFIREMQSKHGFNAAQLQNTFRRAQTQPSILAAMSRPAEAKPWYAYRALFLTPKRIQGGAQFWKQHAAALARAEQTYGVPAQIIVAIIGVETQYGGNMGKYRVFEALATLAFGYPRRANFFRKELENYLLLARAEGIDPLSVRGSYAGAMGFGQFMPSSFRSYAVDFDGDQHRDIWSNPTDAIGSVANYFKKNGWRTGEPVAVPATVTGSRYAALISERLTPPQHSVAYLRSQGVTPQRPVNAAQKAMLLKFAGESGAEYWLGFDNFYAITRYNRSQLYALAVYQLSEAIRQQYLATTTLAPHLAHANQ